MFAALDIDLVGPQTGKLIRTCKRALTDARLDIRDFETADSRAEMQEMARVARHRLDEVRSLILAVSEHGVFSAIDVTQLSVGLDRIGDMLV